jgi:DNA modification methylase
MQRTKAHGLLYKTLRTDSAASRQGLPDYLVIMRKPGVNPKPITHTPEDFPLDDWQEWASPVWMDIDQTDVLSYREAREVKDERHICPLQLGLIRKALRLWSAPDDLVFSPFGGIGSEGYVSLEMGRRFVGAELKRSYWSQAVATFKRLDEPPAQVSLF